MIVYRIGSVWLTFLKLMHEILFICTRKCEDAQFLPDGNILAHSVFCFFSLGFSGINKQQQWNKASSFWCFLLHGPSH